MNQIKTKHNWHPNTSIEFDNTGVTIRVSLNVTREVASKLYKGNVVRGRKHIVYALSKHVPSDNVNKFTLENVQQLLLSNCMLNIRIAKSKIAGI